MILHGYFVRGYFGGTFDPIHQGHCFLAESVCKAFNLDEFYFVPTPLNPLKEKSPRATNTQRKAMVELAISDSGKKNWFCWDYELQKEGPAYTYDSLQVFLKEKPGKTFCVLGDESFQSFPKWKNPKELLALADWILISRDNLGPQSITDTLERLEPGAWSYHPEKFWKHRDHSKRVFWFFYPALPIASSQIRAKLANLETLPEKWLTPSVKKFIQDFTIYTVKS